jgi:hypothetical protein
MPFLSYSLYDYVGIVPTEAEDLSLGDPEGIGIIDIAENSFLSPDELISLQGQIVPLAKLIFECLEPGTSLIEIDADDPLLYVGNEYGYSLLVDVIGAVEVNQVPEPSTLLLVGAGLAGVGLLRKRFKK